jgi:integrase
MHHEIEETRTEWRKLKASSRRTYARISRGRASAFPSRLAAIVGNSFYKYRTAFSWKLRSILARVFSRLADAPHLQTYLQDRLWALADRLMTLEAELMAVSVPAGARTRKGKGARRGLGKLSQDWRLNIVAHATDKTAIYLALMGVCGARPDELQNGIRLTALDDEILAITIMGSKFGETTGQLQRVQYHDASGHPLTRMLYAYAKSRRGTAMLSRKVRRLGKDLHAACVRAGVKKIAPYAFRHQLASDLKADALDPILVAASLGHRTTSTQKAYGAKRLGKRGGTTLLDVAYSDEIRSPARSHPTRERAVSAPSTRHTIGNSAANSIGENKFEF